MKGPVSIGFPPALRKEIILELETLTSFLISVELDALDRKWMYVCGTTSNGIYFPKAWDVH